MGWAKLDHDAIDTKHAKPRWRYASSLEVRQGLAILDATHRLARRPCRQAGPMAPPIATVVRWQGEYERSAGKASFLLSPRAQYAHKPLFSFEEFSAGNFTVGRGYDPGELIGERAVCALIVSLGGFSLFGLIDQLMETVL